MSRTGPIFIGGTDRAGKTLLAAILSSHPNISIPAVGSNMWTLFYRRFGDLAVTENFERCLQAMLRYKHVRFLNPDVPRLRRDFHAGKRTYARLFVLIQEQSAERAGKARWGDQTGLIEGYADEVLGAYADAVMVQMVRDPRDRYDASITMWPEGRLRVGGAVARWRYSAIHALRNAAQHAGRYLVVRYEDLVTQPETTVRRVCEFVGEDYRAAMLEMRGMPSYRQKLLSGRTDVSDGQLISAKYVGSHHGRIPMRELTFLERSAARLMRTFGYEPHATSLAGNTRIRYAVVDVPLNVGRMAIWTVRQEAAHRFPRLMGRKPPRHHRSPNDS
ncbi:MAG: sulfotransferase family protein [Candidatus Limnocylindria bacterium]